MRVRALCVALMCLCGAGDLFADDPPSRFPQVAANFSSGSVDTELAFDATFTILADVDQAVKWASTYYREKTREDVPAPSCPVGWEGKPEQPKASIGAASGWTGPFRWSK